MQIVDERTGETGIYYTLDVPGSSGEPLTVKRSEKHGQFACMTCHSATCAHAAFVRREYDEFRTEFHRSTTS